MSKPIEFSLLDSDMNPDTCDNAGLCCLSCPAYEQCDNHFDEDDFLERR